MNLATLKDVKLTVNTIFKVLHNAPLNSTQRNALWVELERREKVESLLRHRKIRSMTQ